MATAVEDLMKSVASQVQLSSPLGILLQKLASLLGGGGAAAPDVGWVKKASNQTLASGDVINLNAFSSVRGISYDEPNSQWILNPAKRYRLTMLGRLSTFSNATLGQLQVKFVDGANAVLSDTTADSPAAIFRPMTGTDPQGSAAGLEMIYSVPANAGDVARRVRLRVVDATGTAVVASNDMTWVVEEIPGGV